MDPGEVLWAKSLRVPPGDLIAWLPLWAHLQDTADVAGRLWDEWVPEQVKRRITRDIPDPTSARALVVALAGLHDVGKATPAFQVKDATLADRVRSSGLPLPRLADAVVDRQMLPHGLAGHVIVADMLGTAGLPRATVDALAVVVGGHHGKPPESGSIDTARRLTSAMGGTPWREAQAELSTRYLDQLSAALGAGRPALVSQGTQVLISALVIVSDWIVPPA